MRRQHGTPSSVGAYKVRLRNECALETPNHIAWTDDSKQHVVQQVRHPHCGDATDIVGVSQLAVGEFQHTRRHSTRLQGNGSDRHLRSSSP